MLYKRKSDCDNSFSLSLLCGVHIMNAATKSDYFWRTWKKHGSREYITCLGITRKFLKYFNCMSNAFNLWSHICETFVPHKVGLITLTRTAWTEHRIININLVVWPYLSLIIDYTPSDMLRILVITQGELVLVTADLGRERHASYLCMIK